VDEVLAVGDAAFQKKCLGKMEDVATKEGRTVLFVSHNLAAVRNICFNGILLSLGQLIFQGDINLVIDQYLSNMLEYIKFSPRKSGNRFIDVKIKNDQNQPLKVLGIGEIVYLIFELYLSNCRDINLGFTLYKNDIPILSSCALDKLEKLPEGWSELEVKLPVHLLTTGDYRVEGAIWDQTQVYDQHHYLTCFRLERNSLLEARGAGYRGIIAFSGDWSVKKQK